MTRDPANRRLHPPSGGHPAPTEASLGSATLDLLPLAQEVCRRYRHEFLDEHERYGDAGVAWCVHDTQHLLSWGAGEVSGFYDMNPQVAWLADVLAARGFPVDRLARNLEIAAEVVLEHVQGEGGEALATVLSSAAAFVRSRSRSPS